MIVGVTGGAGFIGGHVVDVLNAAGHEAVVFDAYGRKVNGADTMLGDVRDDVAVTEFAAHVDGIIHLAAVLGTQETIANPRPAAEVNILGAVNVLGACRQYDLPLVNICVGNHWMRNTYSSTKACAERLVEQFVTECSLRANQVRVVNAYGPRQRAAEPFASGKVRKIMPAFICRALSGRPIEVYGNGEQVSDCVHVRDVAHALVAAFAAAADGNVADRVLEIGPTEHHTVNDVAELVAGHAAWVTGERVRIAHAPMRPGEEPGATVTCDPSTFAAIGHTPTLTPLDAGIAETVRWFHEAEGVTWWKP